MNIEKGKPKILYIDDDRDFLDLFSIMFRKWLKITTVSAPKTAIEICSQENFDAIITDYEMPEINGLELLEKLKEKNPDLPVIFYTGQGNEEIAREAFVKGAADYFTKEIRGFAHREKLINSIIRASKETRASRERKQNEEKYRYIFEHIRDVYFEISLAGEILELSPSIEEVLKYQKNELLGGSFYEIFVNPHLKDTFIVQILQREKIPDYEIFLKDKYHKVIPCSINVILVKDDSGNPLKIIGSLRNITERKKAEDDIKSRLKNLTLPIDETKDLTFLDLFDLSEIQKIQDAFAKATGVASMITEPDGTPITKPTNFCRLCKNIIRKTKKGAYNCKYSDSVIGRFNPGGPRIQPCLSGGLWDGGASISVGDKHIANWLVGQVRNDIQSEENMLDYAREIGADVEEFRKALQEVPVMATQKFEEICNTLYLLAAQMSQIAYQNVQQARFINEHKKTTEILKVREERYRALVENSPLPIIVHKGGYFIYVNPVAVKFFKAKNAEQLLGKHLRITVHPEDHKKVDNVLKKIDKNKNQKTKSVRRYEAKLQKMNGEEVFADITSLPFIFSGEEAQLAMFVDITNRKKTEQQLLDKNRELSEFAYRVSHDLKGPINLINGFADMIKQEPQLFDEYFHQITKQTDKVLSFISRLLKLSTAGKVLGNQETFNLNELIEIIYNSLVSKDIKAQLNVSRELPNIYADKTAIEQLFYNLIENSIKYQDKDKDKICIEISHEKQEDLLIIKYKDNGIGINREYLEKIFSPGFVLVRDKSTGFGLAISKRIVEAHQGTIKAESEGKNKGTIFTITLPI